MASSVQPAALRDQLPRVVRENAFMAVFAVLGVVLLAAAALKAWALTFGLAEGGGWLASRGLQLAILEFEGLFGLWLMTGACPGWTRRIAMACFGLFASAAFCWAVAGEPSCGCLGALRVSPWWALAFDVGALAALAFVSVVSEIGPTFRLRGLARNPVGQALLLGFAMVVVAFGASTVLFGSPFRALAWIQGSRLTIEPAVIDLGECQAGAKKLVEFEVGNSGKQPVTIVGGTTSCRCVATEGLPLRIGPGKSARVPVRVVVLGREPAFRQTVTLYAGGRFFEALQGQIQAHIITPSQEDMTDEIRR